jgi:predicted RNase H-like HicB family nuclease
MSTVTLTPRHVIISPGEDGWLVAEVPSLPGCISQGRSRAEVIVNIREAIELYIEDLEASGQLVPDDQLERHLVVV